MGLGHPFCTSLPKANVNNNYDITSDTCISSVVASWKEPVPGWVDNMNGPTGLMIGAGKGVIRSMLCNANYLIDMVPCDIAINATIALAWQVGLEKPTKPMFLNATMNQENPITWGDAIEIGKKHALANPFSRKKC